jgi:hypothetical protein
MTRRIPSKRRRDSLTCESCHRPATSLTLTDAGNPTATARLICAGCRGRAGQTDARFARKNQRRPAHDS